MSGRLEKEETKPKPFKRNRAVTTLRIATWGKSPGCEECLNGTSSHTKACRDRFNDLLNSCEPTIGPKKHEPPSADDESKDPDLWHPFRFETPWEFIGN